MFFYAKKIVYLSVYENGEKTGSAGFASLQGEREEVCLKIQVKNAGKEWEGTYPVCLVTGQQEIIIGSINIKSGCGSCERSFGYSGDKAVISSFKVLPEEIYAVQIRLCAESIVMGEWKQKSQPEKPLVLEKQEEELIPGTVKEETVPKTGKEELKAVSVSPDKWEQLKRQYKTIHPFGDEREFISIDPKDFVILRADYQRLVNNSFLLHGFYNYRHLILGRDYQLGTDGNTCFYLGVPGVFFEREKMVAVMFGFEGFESAGPVEIGKFGYYLRKVEI